MHFSFVRIPILYEMKQVIHSLLLNILQLGFLFLSSTMIGEYENFVHNFVCTKQILRHLIVQAKFVVSKYYLPGLKVSSMNTFFGALLYYPQLFCLPTAGRLGSWLGEKENNKRMG